MALQKPNLKNALVSQQYGKKAQAFGEKLLRQLFGATVNFEKARDIVRNNYELGLQHFERGNVKDAIFRFRLVTWLDPAYGPAWYHLGRSYLADGKASPAIAALRKAVRLRPDLEEAGYMLAIAQGKNTPSGELPRKIPLALALGHFDAQAPDFTREQVETYQYQGHTLLTQAIRAALTPGRIDHVVLDLGVGTGLAGPGLRDIAAQMTGVDFSEAMLKEAMQLKDAPGPKISDALIKRELHEFLLEAAAASCDIVLAASTLSYVGDLHTIFQQMLRILTPGGIFAFTVDMQDGPDWRFDPEEGRFRYSQSYLRSMGSLTGLLEVTCEKAPVYPNSPMWLCVFKKA
jgi:predicted TPR repeat methyltransferase